MDMIRPNLCFRRISQGAVSLDPDVGTQEVRITIRSHCKSQPASAAGAGGREREGKQQIQGASPRSGPRENITNWIMRNTEMEITAKLKFR